MVQVFEGWIKGRDVSPEDVDLMRRAYLDAVARLGIADADVESRQALADIVLQLTKVESFRTSDEMATLAVSWFGSLKSDSQ